MFIWLWKEDLHIKVEIERKIIALQDQNLGIIYHASNILQTATHIEWTLCQN
jgi:hypothetical protein